MDNGNSGAGFQGRSGILGTKFTIDTDEIGRAPSKSGIETPILGAVALENVTRQVWVEMTHRRAAAFGKRTSRGGFPAVNPRSRRSQPDPETPDDILEREGNMQVVKLPPVWILETTRCALI